MATEAIQTRPQARKPRICRENGTWYVTYGQRNAGNAGQRDYYAMMLPALYFVRRLNGRADA